MALASAAPAVTVEKINEALKLGMSRSALKDSKQRLFHITNLQLAELTVHALASQLPLRAVPELTAIVYAALLKLFDGAEMAAVMTLAPDDHARAVDLMAIVNERLSSAASYRGDSPTRAAPLTTWQINERDHDGNHVSPIYMQHDPSELRTRHEFAASVLDAALDLWWHHVHAVTTVPGEGVLEGAARRSGHVALLKSLGKSLYPLIKRHGVAATTDYTSQHLVAAARSLRPLGQRWPKGQARKLRRKAKRR